MVPTVSKYKNDFNLLKFSDFSQYIWCGSSRTSSTTKNNTAHKTNDIS